MSSDKKMKTRTPKVSEVREFLEITRDFTDPRDAIREAISNAIDWDATEVKIMISEDQSRADEELVIEIEDNGIGLNEERLEAFFDLGCSIPRSGGKIGYKGHGTKTYFNCRSIEIFSDSKECSVYAVMDSPIGKLHKGEMPSYDYDIESKENKETKTKITICNYNLSKNKRDFDHDVLKDYILWFTLFGSMENELRDSKNKDKVLCLKGLGRAEYERIDFGHKFPVENNKIKKLMEERPGDWTKVFVKKWIFEELSIVDNPGKYIDVVFYIEGDEAKRSYNPMIRVRGKTPDYGMYKVEDRYGLWACKDYIPIKRYNEWLGLGKRMETQYHAFVNCQDFRLTANRGDIGNTFPDLLRGIEKTVRKIYEEEIIGSNEYQEYEEAAESEEQYQTAEQERKDFTRRQKRVKSKKVCEFKGIELIEPGMEMGVIALFNQMYALEPSIFPFRIIDYDTKKGYDALATKSTPSDLSKEKVFFLEFKYMLQQQFSHSFKHLECIICWDCSLSDGAEVSDIENKKRELRITQPDNTLKYTRYMLSSHAEHHNIEVFVLKDYLREKVNIEFRTRKEKT